MHFVLACLKKVAYTAEEHKWSEALDKNSLSGDLNARKRKFGSKDEFISEFEPKFKAISQRK